MESGDNRKGLRKLVYQLGRTLSAMMKAIIGRSILVLVVLAVALPSAKAQDGEWVVWHDNVGAELPTGHTEPHVYAESNDVDTILLNYRRDGSGSQMYTLAVNASMVTSVDLRRSVASNVYISGVAYFDSEFWFSETTGGTTSQNLSANIDFSTVVVRRSWSGHSHGVAKSLWNSGGGNLALTHQYIFSGGNFFVRLRGIPNAEQFSTNCDTTRGTPALERDVVRTLDNAGVVGFHQQSSLCFIRRNDLAGGTLTTSISGTDDIILQGFASQKDTATAAWPTRFTANSNGGLVTSDGVTSSQKTFTGQLVAAGGWSGDIGFGQGPASYIVLTNGELWREGIDSQASNYVSATSEIASVPLDPGETVLVTIRSSPVGKPGVVTSDGRVLFLAATTSSGGGEAVSDGGPIQSLIRRAYPFHLR